MGNGWVRARSALRSPTRSKQSYTPRRACVKAHRGGARARARVVRPRRAACAAARALCESKTLPAAGVTHTRRGCTLPWRMPRTWRRLLAALAALRAAQAQTLA
jgi:hypothetical protein